MLRKYTRISLIAFWALISSQLCFSQERQFVIETDEGDLSSSHSKYLELWAYLPVPDGGIDHWIRTRFSERPGDYFRYPRGADSATLSQSEKNEVKSILQNTIDSSLYNPSVLKNLNGYKYSMDHGNVNRREYHVRYSCADTTYVISGWLGKFLSFYRVITGDIRLSIDDFQQEIKSIYHSYAKGKTKIFTNKRDELNYFIQYADRENMLRVRNYQIFEWQYPDLEDIPPGQRYYDFLGKKYYNLIEVTRFIDEEVMP